MGEFDLAAGCLVDTGRENENEASPSRSARAPSCCRLAGTPNHNPDPDAFIASMIAGDGKAGSLNAGWPYAGYRLTVFATGEEQALEGPNGLGGTSNTTPSTPWRRPAPASKP